MSSFRRLNPKKTLFLLVDIQENFRKAMKNFDALLKNTKVLIDAGKALDIPLICSEQYPKGLGRTVKEFDVKHACAIFTKTQFSMMIPEIEKKICEIFGQDLPDCVLFGIESHVCVEQTAMDLVERGYNVHVVADCCASRTENDYNMAMERFRQNGCNVTTYENIIFNLLCDKNHPQFNVIRKLVATPSSSLLAQPKL